MLAIAIILIAFADFAFRIAPFFATLRIVCMSPAASCSSCSTDLCSIGTGVRMLWFRTEEEGASKSFSNSLSGSGGVGAFERSKPLSTSICSRSGKSRWFTLVFLSPLTCIQHCWQLMLHQSFLSHYKVLRSPAFWSTSVITSRVAFGTNSDANSSRLSSYLFISGRSPNVETRACTIAFLSLVHFTKLSGRSRFVRSVCSMEGISRSFFICFLHPIGCLEVHCSGTFPPPIVAASLTVSIAGTVDDAKLLLVGTGEGDRSS